MKSLRLLLSVLVVCSGFMASSCASDAITSNTVDIAKIVSNFYYDKTRIKPETMVEAAVKAFENSHVGAIADWQSPFLHCRLGGEVYDLPAPKPRNAEDAMIIILQMQKMVLGSNFYEDTEASESVAATLVNAALRTLDPHTLFFPPEPAAEFNEDIRGEFEGIGAWLQQDQGTIKIDRVMPNMPAEKAGVKDGDIILFINGEKSAGLSLREAVKRIKGPRGTTVNLRVERKGTGELIDIPVVRARVKPITFSHYRKNDIGYIRMDEFNDKTAENLRAMLYRVRGLEEAPLKGLVLDLRYNGGGKMDQAIKAADLFLDTDKEVVRTVMPGQPIDQRDTELPAFESTPLMVLISPSSASAAEILAGSLQLHGRAVCIGTQSFGKGSVQTWKRMRGGSHLKFTIQEYQLKDGRSVQGVGIVPDIELLRYAMRKDGHVDIRAYTRDREADNDYALVSSDTFHQEAAYRLGWLDTYKTMEELRVHSIGRPDFVPNQEAVVAMELFSEALKGVERPGSALTREEIIALCAVPVSERSKIEAARLEEYLKKERDITWHDQELFETAQVKMEYIGLKDLIAGEELELAFKVTNLDDKILGRLIGVVDADLQSRFWEAEAIFGDVKPGESVEGVLKFYVPPRIYSGVERFTLKLMQANEDTVLGELPVELHVIGKERPQLSYSFGPVGTNTVNLDAEQTLRVTIENKGKADTAPLQVYLSKNDSHFVQLDQWNWKLDALPAGSQTHIDLKWSIQSRLSSMKKVRFKDEEVILNFASEENFEEPTPNYLRENLIHEMIIPVGGIFEKREIHKPIIEVTEVHQENGKVIVQVKLTDDNPRFLACYSGDAKDALVETKESGMYSLEVPIEEGKNTLRIIALDHDDVLAVRPLRIWADEGVSKESEAAQIDVNKTAQVKEKEEAAHPMTADEQVLMNLRPRRNRRNMAIRDLSREHQVTAEDFILPVFIVEGENERQPIASMPGVCRVSVDVLLTDLVEWCALGLRGIALFPAIADELKDKVATESTNANGLLQRVLRALKQSFPDLLLITDVALDPYSSDGHDGIVQDGIILNDETLPILAAMAVSQAEAGADMVAPSDMMDGRIGYIRNALDNAGFTEVGILSYCAKYASAYYGPFRDALESAPKSGDKKTYQMDPANVREAMRERLLDEQEGADILMVKPGLPYLDVVRVLSEQSLLPIAVYHVSGEFAMLKAAADKDYVNYEACLMESLLCFKRAGANMIFTYAAIDALRLLQN